MPRRARRRPSRKALDGHGHGLAAADAQRGDADLRLPLLQGARAASPGSRAPLAPMGCPRATAPPWTFIFSCGMLNCLHRRHRHHGERLVDLEQVHVADPSPSFCIRLLDGADRGQGEPLRLAGVGGVAEDLGLRLARPGPRPFSAESTTTAAAPSLMLEALPAVTVPSAPKAGRRARSFSSLNRPGSSSWSTTTVSLAAGDLDGRRSPRRRARPSAPAGPAGSWPRRNRPAPAREMCSLAAQRSPQMPMCRLL